MEKKIIISIGRQFGAGGRRVGQALAERLGIAYYDKELILEAAKEYGFAPEFFEQNDEKSASFTGNVLQWMESLVTGGMSAKNYLSQDALFEMQASAIRKIAEEKSCVIVGRCSDYVLRDNPNCISVFLHSTDEDRAQRIQERSNISREEALTKMRTQDKKRAAYYNFYSSKTWGDSATYDLSINVSALGVEKCVDLIIHYLSQR
ncbi:MAG: cytidylate kinase-like family protein [Paludibacteraceae bacterium]|nr:cytidylate kinase-like family protein [Paludibacteraceae bacterium]